MESLSRAGHVRAHASACHVGVLLPYLMPLTIKYMHHMRMIRQQVFKVTHVAGLLSHALLCQDHGKQQIRTRQDHLLGAPPLKAAAESHRRAEDVLS